MAANICLFRRAALEAVEFYRPAVLYSQDWDLAVRLADAGWGNVYCDEVLASYRVWEDAGKVRPKRQMIEVGDCLRIYEGSVMPAFARRNWDDAPVWKARRATALSHGTVIDNPLFSTREQRDLLSLVQRLGNSNLLRVQTRLLKCGLGPVVRAQRKCVVASKDIAKSALATARSFKPKAR